MKPFILIAIFFSSGLFAQDKVYQNLVFQKNYPQALKRVCRLYAIDCKKVKIVKPEQLDEAYAVTANYTNTISLSENAFDYYGIPHDGWLAAIIGHENVHQTQSMYVRQVAGVQIRFLKNYYWEALLEYEAWSHMYINSKKYNLTQSMIDEIKFNMDDFMSVINK